MNTEIRKAWLSAIGIVVIFAVCSYLIYIEIFHVCVLIFAAFGCYPWGKYIIAVVRHVLKNPVKILGKALPKCGFSIDKKEWNEERTFVRFSGKYQGDNFILEAAPNCAYINVYDLPWHSIKITDPQMAQLMEAVNDTNAQSANMSVVVCDPDDEGNRDIYTLSKTILPNYKPEDYLDSLMCDMLNRKRALAESMGRQRPWMKPQRGPIGFCSH